MNKPCPTCGSPVEVVGKSTISYRPALPKLDVEKAARIMYEKRNRNRLGGCWDIELDGIKRGYRINAEALNASMDEIVEKGGE